MDKMIFKSHGLTPAEVKSVAVLHETSIKRGFLSSLGKDFLVMLYKAILRSDAGVLIVALDEEGRVIGFVSGATANSPIFVILLRDSLFILPFVLLPKIFSFESVRKIFDLIIYFFRSNEKKSSGLSAELLSLAVDEKYRGQGIAKELFDKLVIEFQKRGVWKFKIVVEDSLAPAQRFYEKVGSKRYARIKMHKGEVSWMYIFDADYSERYGSLGVDYIRRYSSLFQRTGQKSIILDGILWTSYQRMVVPIGPVSSEYVISSEKYQNDLLRYFKECILIRSGGGFVTTPDAWYSVLCDRPGDLLDLSVNTRSKVRRGLKKCVVRRIDVKYMTEHAWPVYSSAFKRYRNAQPEVSEHEFKRNIIQTEGFEDIINYWGVFEKATGRLIAYTKNYLYDKIEVYYLEVRFHPDFLRLYSSYALLYEMNRYYLDEEKFSYLNDGFRSLLHETNIQDYLINKFFFRKQPIGLKIYYRPLADKCMSSTYPYRHLLRRLYRPVDALYKLEEINRCSTGAGEIR